MQDLAIWEVSSDEENAEPLHDQPSLHQVSPDVVQALEAMKRIQVSRSSKGLIRTFFKGSQVYRYIRSANLLR